MMERDLLQKIHIFFVALGVLTAPCCGDDMLEGDALSNSTVGADSAYPSSVQIIVKHSRGLSPQEGYGDIGHYKVSVSGPEMSEPITAEFDGVAEGGVIDGIPAGSERKVEVEAVNLKDRLIRQGVEDGVTVSSGEITDVEVELDAVPIFVNLEDGSVIASNRLRFTLFADPIDPLEVTDLKGGSESTLFDLGTNLMEVYPDMNTGLATFVPGNLLPGEHIFRVMSGRTGRSSTVTVRLIDGSKIRPAPLFSGGWVAGSGEFIQAARAGSYLGSGAGSGVVWPTLINAVLGVRRGAL